MREIKFRAWDNNSKIFVNPALISINGTGKYAVIDECNGGIITYNGDKCGSEFILMQYTGIMDSRKREIYEGDIYEHSDGLVVVEWNNKASAFEAVFIEDRDANIPIWEIHFLGCNYIGNIHENTELLKV